MTLSTLARAAGVTPMTVSLALRNKPGVSDAKRKLIRELATKLGYRTHPLVSAYQSYIRARRAKPYEANLAWINDHPDPKFWQTRPWLDGYVEGAQRRAAELGFKLEIFHLPAFGDTPERARARLQRVLRSRGIDGVILPWLHQIEHAAADWSEFSIAMIGRNAGYGGTRAKSGLALYHHANPDIYYNTALALRSIREAGAQRVGLAMSVMNDQLAESFQRACFHVYQDDLPLEDRIPVLLEPDPYSPQARERLQAWYARHRPDAVLLYDADLLKGLVTPRRGRPAPRGVQLNLTPQDRCHGVDTRHAEISAACVELVVAQLYHNQRGQPAVPHEVLVKGVWCEPRARRASNAARPAVAR